jgi:hypothetical protein
MDLKHARTVAAGLAADCRFLAGGAAGKSVVLCLPPGRWRELAEALEMIEATMQYEFDWQPEPTDALVALRDRAIDEHRAGRTEPMDDMA